VKSKGYFTELLFYLIIHYFIENTKHQEVNVREFGKLLVE